MTEYITTRWYRAPELLLGQGFYGPEIDFWAIGCLMGEMADGNPVFAGEDEINQLECIIKLIGNLPEELVKSYNDNPDFNINKLLHVDKPETLEKRYEKVLNPEAIDFMKGLLELSPKKRLKDENIFNHKYFACFKNSKNNEKNDEDDKLYYSVSMDKRNKIKIPNLNDNSKEEESKIINIFKYNDDSYIDEKDESNSSEKKLVKNSNSNLDIPLKKQQIKNHFRSDLIDFGKLYLNTENNKVIGKQYNNDKNIFNTESNQYKLIQKK
jgi:cyclin-dependent kinase-like